MTTANAALTTGWSRLTPTRRELARGLAAGVAFCLILTTGFAAMSAWQCGGICLPETVDNAALSLAAGIFGLGPVAAYGGRSS
jgi:hypothetical protein